MPKEVKCPECDEVALVALMEETRHVEIGLMEWKDGGGFSYFHMGPVSGPTGEGEFVDDTYAPNEVYCQSCEWRGTWDNLYDVRDNDGN